MFYMWSSRASSYPYPTRNNTGINAKPRACRFTAALFDGEALMAAARHVGVRSGLTDHRETASDLRHSEREIHIFMLHSPAGKMLITHTAHLNIVVVLSAP